MLPLLLRKVVRVITSLCSSRKRLASNPSGRADGGAGEVSPSLPARSSVQSAIYGVEAGPRAAAAADGRPDLGRGAAPPELLTEFDIAE
jgi:hypothetical protein